MDIIETTNKETGREERRLTFKSYQDIVDLLTGPEVPAGAYSRRTNRETENPLDFWPISWEETWRLFTHGDPAASALIGKISANIRAKVEEEQSYSIDYEVYPGDYIDIGRYLDGEPECFGHVTMQEQPQERIRLRVMSGILGHVNAKHYANRGAAVLALVDLLRRRYHVVLEICSRNVYSSGLPDDFIKYEVDTRNDFSRDLVAFILTNACYHRRINFGIREVMHQEPKVDGGGYGKSADWRPKDKSRAVYIGPIVETDGGPWRTEETAAAEVNRILAEYEANNKQSAAQ